MSLAALSVAAFSLGVFFYASSCAFFFVLLLRGADDRPRSARIAPITLAIGGALHGTYITLASFVAHVCPVESVHFALSVASLVVIVAYFVARLKYRIAVLGAFVAPFSLAFLLGTRFANLGDVGERLPPAFLALHVAANLVGDALFLLACASACLYLFAEKRLKEKRVTGVLGRLPPLDALDRAEHRFLLVGFPMLTLGIISGTVWAAKLEAGNAGDVLRAVFGYVTWIVFAGVLALRAAAGWRGRRAALGTITGFFFATLVLVVYAVRPQQPRMEQPRAELAR